MQKERLGYPMCSFGTVFDVCGERVEKQGGKVHVGVGVRRINVEDGKAVGFAAAPHGGEERDHDYDAVIATTPSYVFTRLAPELPDDYREILESAQYLSAVLMILVLDRPLTSKYWLNVADRSLPFVGVIEHTNMIDRSLYGGQPHRLPDQLSRPGQRALPEGAGGVAGGFRAAPAEAES